MAGENKHLRGATNEIKVPIHGKTVVEKGDFIIIAQATDSVSSAFSGTAGDGYGYPGSAAGGPSPTGTTSWYFDKNFAGIAMKGSVSGVTENIPVATAGIFRYQVKLGTSATAQNVKPGETVAAATAVAHGCGTTVTIGDQAKHEDCIVGTCVKLENSATKVDFRLQSRMSGTSVVA